MYDILRLLHLAAAIVWLGGMTFMLLALRPAAQALLEGPVRARLMGRIWQRFFVAVWASIAVLLASGGHMYGLAWRSAANALGSGSAGVPPGWQVMLVIGIVMMLIFGHIYFAGFARYRRAVAAEQWPAAAAAAAQMHKLVVTNFVLGWLAVAALRLLR
jgi:uncharacterized membrane protein